jgi:uncharacterized membrane protein
MSLAAMSLYAQAILYAAAGVGHFWAEAAFLKVMPPWVPWKKATNRIAGALEPCLALALLWPPLRRPALVGIMVLLVLVFPVHLHMLSDREASLGWPRWTLWLRLPVQGLLFLWAYATWLQSQ